MLTRWRNIRKKERFYRLTRDILKTRPVPVVDAPLTIASMVSKSDVQMYLLSMKSFYRHIRRGKLVAIIDRDTPESSRDVLSGHFPGIRFVILEDIDTGECQRGGTWERILYILGHAESEYTIQLDCDTLAFGQDLSEVAACVESNTSFTLGSMGYNIVTLPEAAELARQSDSNYVGIATERVFDQYPDAPNWRYVRASSGFAGFAKGTLPRRYVEDFHRNMERLLPARWREWGTEQCASNFAVANSKNAVVLHRPKYGNFDTSLDNEKASFLHFFGTHRYKEDFFARKGQEVIKALLA